MAQITQYPLVSHVRGQASSQTLYWKGGRLRRNGRGLSFFFRALSANLAEVPLDDRDLTFLFHGRTSDFQDVVIQGVVTYRLTNAEALADRIDFSLDLRTGQYTKTPLELIGDRLTQLAQQHVAAMVSRSTLAALLIDGIERLRTAISEGLTPDTSLTGMGLAIVSVRVSTVQPDAEMEKALQTPTREQIQQQADQATFARRALAVEKERAIAENELQNRIELARRQAQLVDQEGANARRAAEEAAAAAKIEAEGAAERATIDTATKAAAVKQVEGERLTIEKERIQAYGALPPGALAALAAREFAGRIQKIEHVNISSDALTPFIADLAAAGARRLGSDKG